LIIPALFLYFFGKDENNRLDGQGNEHFGEARHFYVLGLSDGVELISVNYCSSMFFHWQEKKKNCRLSAWKHEWHSVT